MNIIVAENSGFCFGVKRAINKTFEASKKNKKKIFTYGPLIHNNQVINKLEKLGINSIEKIEDAKNSILIIRSHGVPLEIYDRAKEYDIELIDTTCPFVRKVQTIAKEYHEKDYQIIIVGNPNHPEVIGINGWCNNEAIIIESIDEANKLSVFDKICVVAQTTITLEKWNSITKKLKEKAREVIEFNTICLATKERQDACAKLAKKADIMIVIGGYHSSNTQKLYNISKKYCKNTIHIETAENLPLNIFNKDDIIGVTAGASTPEWIINDVINKLKEKVGN
ncbi:4-hydroxy-3-methylbut-2-enyl diphosphate reductase [Caminicella sporogenes DSM 14501]|uniref:4-hydroxy-3-methylbut-2-enyl diphosphate reductase n=1 Tax=Caminicella sporogenes DSM 14501 TaxID=1121266 RepID=A0A1M6L588_9FIRM|nr:4-hydroxy-3-methylbut-2-enyl diphosphate reductase [Caminicella sporogenes]RKD27708.1 4-hydroxy-3-methylbut-2-enyl diphosphate reductase [Caminicella sporogenes]SHJ66330.1 4-hydroxy-3-methylbut-2-enyl diphosphate reductase [Caminicella sporogenes DSM 14501]